jgi:hypothetical protein
MKPHRVISGLRWAKLLPEKPACIPNSRPRGAKAAGLRFERDLSKHLAASVHGQWFEFRDDNGHGYCQTDLLYSFAPSFMAVLEAKYTLVPGAFQKLVDLYLPIVSMAAQLPAVGVCVVRNLEPSVCEGSIIFTDLHSAAQTALVWKHPTILHWRGQQLLPHIAAREAA